MAAPAKVACSNLQASGINVLAPHFHPRQERQVDGFLGIFEERLARRANLRTHGKGTSKINELAGAQARESRTVFARADRVAEPTFHQRCPAGGRVLQELPDLRVVQDTMLSASRGIRFRPSPEHSSRSTLVMTKPQLRPLSSLPSAIHSTAWSTMPASESCSAWARSILLSSTSSCTSTCIRQ